MEREPRVLPGFEPSTVDDPYPYLARMRAAEPVYRDDTHGAYVLTRYEDVEYAERNPDVFSAEPAGIGPVDLPGMSTREAVGYANQVIGAEPRTLINNDPPGHTRYRKLMSRLMSRRRVDSHEDHIRAAAHRLLDRVTELEFDLADGYTRALPVTTICRELSLPPDFEDEFLGWAAMQKMAFGNPEVVGPLVLMAADGSLPNPVADYFTTRIAELRKEPQDDLLSAMIESTLKDGSRLDDAELLGLISHFLVAGHDTTTATMNNALIAMMRDDRLFDAVRADFGLLPKVIEEALRYDCPVLGLYRLTTKDVEIGDTLIPADSLVLLSYAAANRDPAHFEDPDRFDPGRFDQVRSSASPHLAFGTGPHFCVGANLARLQARIGLEIAVTRLEGLRLAPPDQHFERIPSVILRGVETLQVRIDRLAPHLAA